MNYSIFESAIAPKQNLTIQVEKKMVSSDKIILIGSTGFQRMVSLFSDSEITTFGSFHETAYYLQHASERSELFQCKAIIGCLEQNYLDDIVNFAKFLRNSVKLSSVPFILMNEKPDLKNISANRPLFGVDDIVQSDISKIELVNKINTLTKFKSLQQHVTNHGAVVIKTDRKIVYSIDSFFRRVLDILISAISLVILMPLLILIAIIIKIDSKGPIFYTSYRAGSSYKIFKFIKFRTMVTEADNGLNNLMKLNQYGPSGSGGAVFFKINNDPRITRFGKFLRNTSLDELPQLFNVLKADMSLVGNRPLPLYEAKALTTDKHAERFNAPAGITGLWQISKRGQKDMSTEERIELDISYARHNSFGNDLQILLKTPKALIQKENV